MNDEARLKLKNMVNEYKPEETTDKIRKLKHSRKIKSDVMQMLKIKKNNSRLKMETVKKMCENQCSFLRENYTNIFNKLFKGDLDLMLLDRFISILKDIEDGKLDQHEASAKVGAILKEIYIDSALREDKKREKSSKRKEKKIKKISWNDFKSNLKYEQYKNMTIKQ